MYSLSPYKPDDITTMSSSQKANGGVSDADLDTPEGKIRAWLTLDRREDGHLKAGVSSVPFQF